MPRGTVYLHLYATVLLALLINTAGQKPSMRSPPVKTTSHTRQSIAGRLLWVLADQVTFNPPRVKVMMQLKGLLISEAPPSIIQ
jgi:hypothetical protein